MLEKIMRFTPRLAICYGVFSFFAIASDLLCCFYSLCAICSQSRLPEYLGMQTGVERGETHDTTL